MAIQSIQKLGAAAGVQKAQGKLNGGTSLNPKGELGKDQFLQLLLTELKHQDPTAPVETDKILSQTSQLASLEASTNTNKELKDLASALQASMRFSTVGSIGKVANIGNDEVILAENGTASFEMYFPKGAKSGTIDISDTLGNVVKSITINEVKKGVNLFEWNGEGTEGSRVEEGSYHVKASYIDSKGLSGETALGTYPISSLKFENGKTMMKLGSQYVPFEMLKEIYDAKS